MGRGIVESGTFRTERVGMELRTSDPAITKEGEAWIRTDIAPNTDQLATLRFDGGASTFDVPIFDSAASVTNVEKVWRIPIGGTIGFIPLAAAGESGAYPQVKYQHNGNALDGHDRLVAGSPDTTMFQSPIYQWWGGAGIDVSNGTEASSWEDQLASIVAFSVGDPIYRADQAGFEAVEYDATDDGHDWSSDSQLPTGTSSVSIAALVYFKSTAAQAIASWGTANFNGDALELKTNTNGNLSFAIAGEDAANGQTPSTGNWMTIGGQHNGGDIRVLRNGSVDGTNTATPDIADANHSLGYRRYNSDDYADAYIAEVIVSAAYESETAYSDYHTDRLG